MDYVMSKDISQNFTTNLLTKNQKKRRKQKRLKT